MPFYHFVSILLPLTLLEPCLICGDNGNFGTPFVATIPIGEINI